VQVGDDLGAMVQEWGDELLYGDRHLGEVAASANELVGDYDMYIVFGVDLDTTETAPSRTDSGGDDSE
jgi:hypothetical protein